MFGGRNFTDERYDNAQLNTGDYVSAMLSNDASEFDSGSSRSSDARVAADAPACACQALIGFVESAVLKTEKLPAVSRRKSSIYSTLNVWKQRALKATNALCQVPTKALNQAVQRNIARFPGDFMFQLNETEFAYWKSQIVTSNPGAVMGLRKRPYAFTEHGVAMLSSVLRSKRAVRVNID